MDLSLDRIKNLLSLAYDNPQNKLPITHVTGTNGKGSVCAYVAAVLMKSGYRVGRFNSPHLVHPSDCIRINGSNNDNNHEECDHPMGIEDYDRIMADVIKRDNELKTNCSNFERLTVCCFLYFVEMKCDICIIEVGMGGRLDATNVAKKPLVCVFTPISLDHQAYLGNTVTLIAKEKSGILREHTDVIIGKQSFFTEATEVLLEECERLNCIVRLVTQEDVQNMTCIDTKKCEKNSINYQHENQATAMAVLEILKTKHHFTRVFEAKKMREIMSETRWKGRLEWCNGAIPDAHDDDDKNKFCSPLLRSLGISRILIDGAHNDHGAKALAQYVQDIIRCKENSNVHWIFGFSSGKDVSTILKSLVVGHHDRVSFCSFSQPIDMPWISCYDVTELKSILKELFPSSQDSDNGDCCDDSKGNHGDIRFELIENKTNDTNGNVNHYENDILTTLKYIQKNFIDKDPEVHDDNGLKLPFPISYKSNVPNDNNNSKDNNITDGSHENSSFNTAGHKRNYTIVVCGSLYLLKSLYSILGI